MKYHLFSATSRIVGLLLVSANAVAQSYPERPIRWIVPAAAGGGADVSARVYAVEMSRILGQQVVIDNRPGAAGTIGIGLVARAAPDGYTVGAGNITNFVMNRSTAPRTNYDPDRDLKAVVQTHFQPNMLVVAPATPARSVAELRELAKKSPGKLLYASSGNGSSLHFAGELFKMMSGAEITHVPYSSLPIAINDLIGGRVQMVFDNMTSAAPHVRAGRLRGLGVTSLARSNSMPEMPTIHESGLPGYELIVWSGIVAPAKTPAAIINRLNMSTNEILKTPAVREKLNALGVDLAGGSSAAFTKFIAAEVSKWADVAKRAGIKSEQ